LYDQVDEIYAERHNNLRFDSWMKTRSNRPKTLKFTGSLTFRSDSLREWTGG